MSYGITIINKDDRVQIDTGYTNIYPVSEIESVASGGSSAYPPTNYVDGDLVLARAAAGINGGVGWSTIASSTDKWFNGDPNIGFPGCSSMPYYLVRKFYGNVSPTGTAYGLEVYDTSATKLLFSATTSNKALQLVATGTIPGTGGTAASFSPGWSSIADLPNVVYYPSKTGVLTDLDKHYCAINPAKSMSIYGQASGSIGFTIDIAIVRAYEYIWTGTNQGRIKIHNYVRNNSSSWKPGTIDFNYQIYKELS